MCLRFVFLLIRVPSWLQLSRREEAWKTAEILILRHQLAVLQRQQPRRPELDWADRALLATLLAVIPKARRHGLRLLVTPDTILRWHRDIVAAGAAGAASPVGALRAGAQLFPEACAEPEVERIILPGAPAVLGRQAWRDLAGRYGLGLIQLALPSAMDAGVIVPQPVVPLAHVLIGALGECALCAARAGGPCGGAGGARRDF
jgi:hypothetical protein